MEALLSLEYDGGVEHPIAFFSSKLLPRETRYATVEIVSYHSSGNETLCSISTWKTIYRQDELPGIKLPRPDAEHDGQFTQWAMAIQPLN